MPLTCPICFVDSPSDDYSFCLNCGSHLEEETVVHRKAAWAKAPKTVVYRKVPTERNVDTPASPKTIIISEVASALAKAILVAVVLVVVLLIVASAFEQKPSATYTSEKRVTNVVTLHDPGSTVNPAFTSNSVPIPTSPESDAEKASANVELARIQAEREEANRAARQAVVNSAANHTMSDVANVNRDVRRLRIPREPPPNAVALCMDGSFAFEVHSWACANRGGVAEWFVNGIDDGRNPRAICRDGHISYWTHDRVFTCGGGGVRYWYY